MSNPNATFVDKHSERLNIWVWVANTQLAVLRTTVVGGGGDNARRQRRQLLNGTDVVVVATLLCQSSVP